MITMGAKIVVNAAIKGYGMIKFRLLIVYIMALLSVCSNFAGDDYHQSHVVFSIQPAVSKYSEALQPKFFADNYHPCAPCPTDYNPRRYTTDNSGNYELFPHYQRQPGTTQYALNLLGDYNQYTHDATALQALIARQDEALQRYDLYKNRHFRQQIKQLPNYKKTIKRLYAIHKNTKLPRLQAFLGDYDMTLRAVIFKIHNEIEAEEKEQKKGQASDHAKEQHYDQQREKEKQRAEHQKLKTAHAQEKVQAQKLLHAYERHRTRTTTTHASQLIRQRVEAIHSAYDSEIKIYAKTYVLNAQSHWLLESQGHSVTQFTTFTGNDYQHQLNSEHIELIDQTESIFAAMYSIAFQDRQLIGSILECVTVASEYNHKSRLIEATSMTDSAWSLLNYVVQHCEKARQAGTYFYQQADSYAYRGEYIHATGCGLASLFCHACASFDYVIAASKGVVQGSANVADALVQCGTTLTTLDRNKVYVATESIATSIGQSLPYLWLLEDIEADLALGEGKAAAQKLHHIADTCFALKNGIENKLQELKHASSHEIVTQSCTYVTESFLAGKMLGTAKNIVTTAQSQALQLLSVVDKTHKATSCAERAHCLHAVSDLLKTCKEVAPIPDTIKQRTLTEIIHIPTTAIAPTFEATTTFATAPMIDALTPSADSLVQLAAYAQKTTTQALSGALIDELMHLQNDSSDQSHLPKHLRQSILTQPMLNPDDPDKNKNNKDNDKGPAKREQVLPQVETYEQARNKALEIIGDVDQQTATPHVGRIGVGKGKITGIDWHGGDVSMRLDWDPVKGPHINITDYRIGKGCNGTSVAILFEGDITLVKDLLKHLNTKASIDAAIDTLRKFEKNQSLALLLKHLEKK